ncbi:extracellular calcium-sensing receptor-like [Oculina patagonica]
MLRTRGSALCLGCLIFWCYTVVQAPYKHGDVILAGLFNAHKLQGTSEGQCGDIDNHGVGRAEAMIFAIEKINNDSNLLPNISLGYDIRDYCENVTKASRLTYELLKDQCGANVTQNKLKKKSIVALIGPFESRTALVIGGFLQMLNVSAISGTTVSPELSSYTYKHLYRTVPPDTFLAKAIADIIEHFNWSYVAAVGLDDSYGRNGIWSLVSEAASRKNPFCIAMTEFIRHETQFPSMVGIVNKLKRQENIKVVVLWIYGSYQSNFFTEVSRQNITGRIWLLTEVDFDSNPTVGKFISPGFSTLHGSLGFHPHNFNDAGFQKYLKDLLIHDRSKENKQNLSEWWNEIEKLKCNCLARTTKVDSKIRQNERCSQAIVDEIYNPYIPYTIDAVYSVAHALDILRQETNLTSNWDKAHNMNLGDVQRLLRRVDFTGLTGKIKFDELGDRDSSFYDIVNLQEVRQGDVNGITQVHVGEWQERGEHAKKLRFHENIRWNSPDGKLPKSECLDQCSPGTRKSITSPCCWQCVPCPSGSINSIAGSDSCNECDRQQQPNKAQTECIDLPSANFRYSSGGGVVILVFVTCGIVVTLFSFYVLCRSWNTPIVKASNRELSLFLLIAIILMLSMAFINLFEHTDIFCKIIYPWRYITYNLCLSFILVKVLLISSAFQVPIVRSFTVSSLSSRMQGVIVITLHALPLLLLLPWLILDPPFKIKLILREEYTFVECKAYNILIGKYFFLAICSFIFLHMSLCAFFSFKVRKIPENFSEAKRIAFSMYIFLISLLAYHPVEFYMDGWYVTVVDCVTTLLSAYGFLCCIFLPKIYIILFRPELNTSASVRQEVTQFSFGSSSVHLNSAFGDSLQQS